MSGLLNENPHFLDVDQLPSRKVEGDDEILGDVGTPEYLKRKKLLQDIDPLIYADTLRNLDTLDELLMLESLENLDNKTSEGRVSGSSKTLEGSSVEPIDEQEIYDLIAHISDPEHPLSLGQLSVVNLPDIEVHDDGNPNHMAEVIVRITPTITHCSLATLIGLGIRVRLERSLPPRYRTTILLKEGTHSTEKQVNKQLNDKERIAAACENEQLLSVITKMLLTCK